jgi:hypothetical protein
LRSSIIARFLVNIIENIAGFLRGGEEVVEEFEAIRLRHSKGDVFHDVGSERFGSSLLSIAEFLDFTD